MEGEANEAEGICRLPASPESGISVGCRFRKGFLPGLFEKDSLGGGVTGENYLDETGIRAIFGCG